MGFLLGRDNNASCTKSLSENLRCAEGNKSTCQFEHRQVVLDLLFPPDQQAPKAVDPRMRPFHDPAAGTVARNLSFGGGFFAARPNMGDIVPCRYGIAHLLRVKALV